MHFADRGYALILLTALLAVSGIWSNDPVLEGAWRVAALLLLTGLAIEGALLARTIVHADIETAPRARLGHEQRAAFSFRNESPRPVRVEYAPVLPAGFEPMSDARRITAPRFSIGRDPVTLFPARLGTHPWPALPTRLLGRFGLAWWSRSLTISRSIPVVPDTLRAPRRSPSGTPTGMRPRRVVGAGSELHQLRSYVRGDPLARIDWKATARSRRLVTREFSEDQHLDILVAIDAGRLSRVRAGRLDRFGLYANIAARLAQVVIPNDDRIGLVVYSDRVLAVCAPARGMPAVARLRHTLERLSVDPAESDSVAAAARIRGLLEHRTLVVMLTDLDDATGSEQLARGVRLLSPPHLVVVAGVRSREIPELARRPARNWRDAWIALAAEEQEARASAQRVRLRRLGAPVVAVGEESLEQAVFAQYEALRRARRV
jgi:uncharacterized protein (DUF58 family)